MAAKSDHSMTPHVIVVGAVGPRLVERSAARSRERA
jgi:hypothetical protein